MKRINGFDSWIRVVPAALNRNIRAEIDARKGQWLCIPT